MNIYNCYVIRGTDIVCVRVYVCVCPVTVLLSQ